MNNFAYTAVSSAAAALAVIAQNPEARFVAGGTNILDLMKDAVETPPMLVDINALPFHGIEQRGDAIYIGAMARMSEVAAHSLVREHAPMVAIALEQSASPQLRHMASMGGNLMQKTRCPYFRDRATPCNKRAPGSGCGAIGGVNRRQAVLGTSAHCIATHASDVAVAFTALNATVHVAGPRGDRNISVLEFYRVPGDTPDVENALAPDELITGITFPISSVSRRSTYLKVRDRAQYDFALASAAVGMDIEHGRISETRIALGGVATIPWRALEAERVLAGERASRGAFERAAETALAGARGYGQNDFKILLAKRTVVRALEIATEHSLA
jgi:xanthine dehydrogenase YagS FAD-binding subunit